MTKLSSRVTRLERRAGGGGHIPRPQSAIDRHHARDFKAHWNLAEKIPVRGAGRARSTTPEDKALNHAADALLVGDSLARRDRDNELIEAWARSKSAVDAEAAELLHKFETTRLIRWEHPNFGKGWLA